MNGIAVIKFFLTLMGFGTKIVTPKFDPSVTEIKLSVVCRSYIPFKGTLMQI